MLSTAFRRLVAHPHQQLRLALREVTDDERLKQIVNSCSFTNLALVDGNGPYAVRVSFGCVWGTRLGLLPARRDRWPQGRRDREKSEWLPHLRHQRKIHSAD
jgi:hypothetical protein